MRPTTISLITLKFGASPCFTERNVSIVFFSSNSEKSRIAALQVSFAFGQSVQFSERGIFVEIKNHFILRSFFCFRQPVLAIFQKTVRCAT